MFVEGWRTPYEAAKALGKPTGSVLGVIKRMHRDGLLKADTDPPTRGTQYRLTPDAEVALAGAVEKVPSRQALESGQRLLLVPRPPRQAPLMRVLEKTQFTADLAWVAEADGGWLLGFDPGLETSRAVDLLIAELEGGGIECERITLGDVQSGALFRGRAEDLTRRTTERQRERSSV